jgi:hypothetical protein
MPKMMGDFWQKSSKIFQIGKERLLAFGNKLANGGLSRDFVGKISRTSIGWLGRLDSNQGMAESISA